MELLWQIMTPGFILPRFPKVLFLLIEILIYLFASDSSFFYTCSQGNDPLQTKRTFAGFLPL
jgi:hypothetical protein